jgi:CubicO group peptidase (beta-lactamase class C family)
MKLLSALAVLMSVAIPFQSKSCADTLPFLTGKEAKIDIDQLRHIELAIGKHLDKKELAGAVTLILRKGGIVHLEAHGWKDLESRTPMTTDTIFRIFSMTKPIVSIGVMMLVEEGKIELDDPIEKHLHQLKGLTLLENGERIAPNRAPTVRDLLRHTAGLTYGFFGDSEVDKLYVKAGALSKSNDTATFIKKVGSLPLAYHPGEKWVYSISVDVQGALIEQISGQSLDRFLKERILEPLGMKDTGFHVPVEKRDRFASLYTNGQKALESNEESDYRFPPRFFSGGGGLVSTASDYAKFLQMMINGGELFGTRFLKKETVQNMTRNHLEGTAFPIGINDTRDGFGFGLGFNVITAKSDYDEDAKVGEYGWGGAASTHFWVSPEDELAVITMEQTMPYTWNLERSIKGLVYNAIIE